LLDAPLISLLWMLNILLWFPPLTTKRVEVTPHILNLLMEEFMVANSGVLQIIMYLLLALLCIRKPDSEPDGEDSGAPGIVLVGVVESDSRILSGITYLDDIWHLWVCDAVEIACV